MKVTAYAIVSSCIGAGCTAGSLVKEADAVTAHLVRWSVTDDATGMTLSTGCALDERHVPDSGQYARVIHVTEGPGATVVEQVKLGSGDQNRVSACHVAHR
jgi:hypothetical protein